MMRAVPPFGGFTIAVIAATNMPRKAFDACRVFITAFQFVIEGSQKHMQVGASEV
jgi:hypothetical protein